MLDDTEQHSDPPKATLSPRPEAKPVPICTVMSDGSIQVVGKGIGAVELNRLLLATAAAVTDRAVTQAVALQRVLAMINSRFDGFDEETAQAIASVLNPQRGGQ